jgi:plastocyanin
MRKAAIAVAALGVVLFGVQVAYGGTSQAASWTVLVGEQTRAPAGTPKQTTLNQFFPARIRINAGDKVTFNSFGFHTVSYGGKPAQIFIPDPQKATYEGINDAAGQPYYFDGLPKFIYNVPALSPYGGTTIVGKKPVSAGVVSSDGKKPATATFTFPKVGFYTMLCKIHPGMKMQVVVKPEGEPVPSADEVAAQAKAETDAAWAKADALAATKPRGKTIAMGVGGSTTILDFFPAVTRVKAGDTVLFANKAPSEIHDVLLGPIKYADKFFKQTDFFPQGPKGKNQVTPVFLYGTDPKPYSYDKTVHGNGFFVTPITDGAPGGLPSGTRITFAAPGKYHFVCGIHGPDMAADVIVTK